AGHVDHGKTALIKALTGVDTDRLKEEKKRGITIELGFASLALPSGQTLGIVDVPGHEKFIKNMVSGAAGIDLVMMVIAADEGIMPQTKEHLYICSLLGISKGIVALTKTDMVEKEWLDLVQSEITEFLQGTFLEGAPVVPVSAIKQEGLTDLIKAIDTTVSKINEKTDDGIFRLPVDRVFTMKGFG
ncbi:MAG TPA: selenocysteine-specific translation factor, partial [Smithella sp.]|nr:selenocysteine-specific translation factor [Smithella sp.]